MRASTSDSWRLVVELSADDIVSQNIAMYTGDTYLDDGFSVSPGTVRRLTRSCASASDRTRRRPR